MGVCNSSGPNRNRKNTNNNESTNQIDQIRQKFHKEIKNNYFFSMDSSRQTESFISQIEYTSLDLQNFIETNNKLNNIVKKQLTTVYCLSIPYLSSIYPEQKVADIFFINLLLFLLSNGDSIDKKIETINNLLVEAYDGNQKKYDLEKLNKIFNCIVNICFFIITYFVGALVFMNEENKGKIFNEENYYIQNKFQLNSLSDYFFEELSNLHNDIDKDKLIYLCENFLMSPIISNLWPEDKDKYKERVYDNIYRNLSEIEINEIRYRFSHLFESFVFIEIFITQQINTFNMSKFKSDKK